MQRQSSLAPFLMPIVFAVAAVGCESHPELIRGGGNVIDEPGDGGEGGERPTATGQGGSVVIPSSTGNSTGGSAGEMPVDPCDAKPL